MPHGGIVLRSGETGNGTNQIVEFGLKLDSNPEFTASVLIACARAVHRFAREGAVGAKTMFDIPYSYLSPKSAEQLRAGASDLSLALSRAELQPGDIVIRDGAPTQAEPAARAGHFLDRAL